MALQKSKNYIFLLFKKKIKPHIKKFLVHKQHKSCYRYYEYNFQSKFDRKEWKDTKLTLCYYHINISL